MHRTEVEVHVVNKFLCQLFFWEKKTRAHTQVITAHYLIFFGILA